MAASPRQRAPSATHSSDVFATDADWSAPAPLSALTTTASPLWSTLIGWVLLLTLGFGLVVPKLAGAGFLLLALMAMGWLSWQRLWFSGDLHPLEHLFVLLVVALVGLWLLAWAWHGLHPAGAEGAGRMLRLLLIVPVFLMLRRTQGLDAFWWPGLVIGSMTAGGYAIWHALTDQPAVFEGRVGGFTNPIYFGGIALAFAMMLLAKVVDDQATLAWRTVALLAMLMAMSASALSGSRGAWLALLPMLALFVFTLGRQQSWLWRLGVPVVMVMAAVTALLWPGLPTAERLAEIGPALAAAWQGESSIDALGRRFTMWSVVFDEVSGRWWLGAGPGAFQQGLLAGIEAGRIDPLLSEYRHPHSQYLSALVDMGVMGLLVLLCLFAVLARRFLQLWAGALQSTRLIGWCGLAAIAVLAVMALSESIFERNIGIVWFGLFTSGCMGLLQASRRHELRLGGKSGTAIERRHALSVMIIAHNEADRIERALRSVAGWANELVVVDSGSDDGTVALCRRYTDQVICTDWPGFGVQKQRALAATRHPWVLSMDADEALSEELKAEIDLVLAQAEPDFSGFTLPWATWAFGRWLRHGHWARAPLRLFHRDHGQFTDAAVHERVVMSTDSAVGKLEGPLLHAPYRSLAHAREKLSRYAELQATVRAGKRHGRILPLEAELRATINFIDNFLLRGAFIDGRAGLRLSLLTAAYTHRKYKLLEKTRTPMV